MMRIGQDISTPEFQITIYPLTKGKETKFGSSYAFKIEVVTPDYVSEEDTYRQINEQNWRKIIIEKLCGCYPDAKKVKNGLHIPSLKATIGIPDTIFSKYLICNE